MPTPEPYLLLPGTAREALTFSHGIFGGELTLNTFGQFRREDGPADAVAHGILRGPVSLSAADAAAEEPFRSSGLMFSLLGAASGASFGWDRMAHGGPAPRCVDRDAGPRVPGAIACSGRDRGHISASPRAQNIGTRREMEPEARSGVPKPLQTPRTPEVMAGSECSGRWAASCPDAHA